MDVAEDLNKMKIVDRHALRVNQDWLPGDYSEKVDESILNISFKPDIFQKQSFYFLSTGQSVFVSAHTSSGKTLVAEYAIYLAQTHNTRVIYTSPIKALSNQKFYDFKHKFDSVGLITGDVQVNPEAQCIIMTTEILRNLVYKNSDLLRDTEFIVFDEVHYINDPDRGVVWEESIIMAPKHINFVMLSATIPNAMEFSGWVGRTKDRCIYVISTSKRAVPLEFVVYCDSEVFSIDEAKSNKGVAPLSNFKGELSPFSKKTKMVNRFKVTDLGNFVNNRKLTPAIFFSFSKRMCEEFGKTLQLLDLTNHSEKMKISEFLDAALSNLKEEDRYLPQIKTMREQAFRGVAVHHGSLLPFVKECVEILFSQNLIRILVATETFAMGVNMPAKCCVFTGITKIDNGSFRSLTSGEFIQMSGRAGRRGMDRVGTVIIADQRMPNLAVIKRIITGTPHDLNSHFKLSFSLILTALRSNIEVEELMRNSFKEHGNQKGFNSDMVKLSVLESKKQFSCEFCPDIIDFLNNLSDIIKENHHLIKKILKIDDIIITKNNQIKRVVSIHENFVRTVSAGLNLSGRLFNRKLDDLKPISEKYLTEYPPTMVSESGPDDVALNNIIFMVNDHKITSNYNLTDLQHVISLSTLKAKFDTIERAQCLNCPSFEAHYYEAVKTRALIQEINSIKTKYSAESLEHMVEYSARVRFLTKNGFVEDDRITLKGRAAAEIRTLNDVLVIELIFRNQFKDFDHKMLISIFSSMINEEEEKTDNFEIYDELKDKAKVLENFYEMLSEDIDNMGIPRFEPLNFGMVNAVYDWCNGQSLGSIVTKHLVHEGAFVRLVLRLEECCREMINVSVLIGDIELEDKFKKASECLKRDVVFLPSLYI